MRKRRVRHEEGIDINLTPMLDVVFIMLIFFIVTATFIKEAGIDVFRPDAETARQQALVSVLVAVSASGDIWIDKRKVPPESLKPYIERVHTENPKGGLVVQADRDAKAEQLFQVLDAAREAGITDVAVATER